MTEAIKHILRGASSVLQIWPNNLDACRKKYLERTDADAVYHDWIMVGKDIKHATEKYATNESR